MKSILIFAVSLLVIAGYAQTEIAPAGRTVFNRLEKAPALKIQIKTTVPLQDIQAVSNIGGIEKSGKLPAVKAGTEPPVSIPFEANLRPGRYPVKVVLRSAAGELASCEVNVDIVSAREPEFPVILTGSGDPAELKKSGFTHVSVNLNESVLTPDFLNRLLENRLYLVGIFDDTLKLAEQYPRLNRNQKPYSPLAVDASDPQVLKLSLQSAEKAIQQFGSYPLLSGVSLNPDAQADTNPSFGAYEPAAFKKAAGINIPAAVTSRISPNYQLLKDFPGSRILPEKDPIWIYYKWFWTGGDGWAPLNKALAEAFVKGTRPAFFVINEISSNIPPFADFAQDGKDFRYLSRKISFLNEPLAAAYETDRLIAAAGDRSRSAVLPDLSLYWERAKAAPGPLATPVKPFWLEQQPQAEFLSVSPDCLRESFWAVISRQVDGLGYNGHGLAGKSYYTDRDSTATLEYLLNKVIFPLGPVLKRLPGRVPEVLVLHSAASAILADDHREWLADLYLALQWGNFQTALVYEDQIRRGALNDAKILVMPACEILEKDIFEEVKKFQNRAGIVVADEYLVPGIVPDLMIRSRARTGNSAADKAAFQRLGADLGKALEPHFKPYASSSNQDLVVRVRSYKEADYLFVINDKRRAGEYVGYWGYVQERGEPNAGNIYVGRNMNYGYDLVNGEELIVTSMKNGSGVGCSFETTGGQLIMLLPDRINQVTAALSVNGKTVKAEIRVLNEAGKPIEALLPVDVSLRGQDDSVLDGSGYHCAVDGVLVMEFHLAENEPAGELKLLVREIASGKTAIARQGKTTE